MSPAIRCAPPLSPLTSEYESELLVMSLRDGAEKLQREIGYPIGVDYTTNTPIYLAIEKIRQDFDSFQKPRRFSYID